MICKENLDNTLYINYERDLLDRIRKETKTDRTGKILFEIAYTYDKDGKGNFTKTQYIENFINPINQKVLQIKKTDPKNIKTVLTYDIFSISPKRYFLLFKLVKWTSPSFILNELRSKFLMTSIIYLKVLLFH